MTFWIVAAVVLVLILGGAWLYDRRHRVRRIDRTNPAVEAQRGEIAAQVMQQQITDTVGRNSP